MSGRVESSMTGSRSAGPLKPPSTGSPLLSSRMKQSPSGRDADDAPSILRSAGCHEENPMRHRVTPVRPQSSGQPIQLTPLWEHVVHTRRFPADVDTRVIFDEITSRLKDPEWEVRQHALRVLVDVLPTLGPAIIDDSMVTVLPELVNNLGHLAPAVRKGALDTIRIYLLCSENREQIVAKILDLVERDNRENFQTSVTLGVILSTPSLLFPSTSCSPPSDEIVKRAIGALTDRLVHVSHQEAALRSLVKINELLGNEKFDECLGKLNINAKRDYEILCDVYKIRPSGKNWGKSGRGRRKETESGRTKIEDRESDEKNNNGDAEENSLAPGSRIVLETEIKFNEETAITMRIIESKDNGEESSDELSKNPEIQIPEEEKKELGDVGEDGSEERRKTPRRVHFGGEIVKLRTPDSDDSELGQADVEQTRIPVPISPAMRVTRSRKSRSNPSSPNVLRSTSRKSKSVSSSPRREFYVHDGSLSPKKGILARGSSAIARNNDEGKKSMEAKVDTLFGKQESDDGGWTFEICDNDDFSEIDPFANASLVRNPPVEKPSRETPRKKGGWGEKSAWKETDKSERRLGDLLESEKMTNDSRPESLTKEDSPEGVGVEIETRRRMDEEEEEKVESIRDAFQALGEEKMEDGRTSGSFEAERAEERSETNERNVRSSSSSIDSHTSPRSPKKHVFETFPRKERNYILMELSSPVKRNSSLERRASEKIDEETRPDPNNSSLSRQDSGLDRSVTRERPPATGRRISSSVASNDEPGTTENSQEAGKSLFEESQLTDIVISEPAKFRESNWEDLGLVDQEVLDDLHNKDDWRARVRGLERVASALRTSSALVAIEPRLGSLLQAVLGGERSCRVAAAGMAVARVVVAGVSEEALKRRLPQVAWGLARQGGPNAAQLARVAMLRLRPALLLEQLLQPHCIKARNAKTRENALQLLIFSLVTFPSTEFKVENVAYKVACMVGDKRRRVRQAALDTLAVLAQIYEPEEVTKAGKLAAKGQQDGDAMLAAIRARLARKSLPMVSADGLVLYGLQISPTIQIATGPDVDWIVAGSGSVSPGTGRTRGQIIATSTRQGLQEKNAKKESGKNASRGANFVALGVGLETKNEHKKPLAWQLVQHSAQDEAGGGRERDSSENCNVDQSERFFSKSRLTGTLRHYRSAADRLDESFDCDDPIFIIDEKDVIMKQRKTEENFHKRMDQIYGERIGIGPMSQDTAGNRLESRIPVAQPRETNGKDTTRIGMIYPRKRLPQDGHNSQNWSAGSRVSDSSRPTSTQRDDHIRAPDLNRYRRITRDFSPLNFSPSRDTYRSIYRQGRGFADGNVYREVQTAPTTTSYDVTRRRQSLKDSQVSRYVADSRRADESRVATTTSDRSTRQGNSNLLKGEKNTLDEEEEYNEINKRNFSGQANSYRIQDTMDRSSQCSGRRTNGASETSSNGSSNISGDYEHSEGSEKLRDDGNSGEEGSFVTKSDEVVVASPCKSPGVEKSFDVITHETNPSRRGSVNYEISSQDIDPSLVAYVRKEESDTDKDSSTEEASLPRTQSSHENIPKSRDYENDSSEIEETSNGDDKNVGTTYVANESNSSDDAHSKASEDSPFSNESHQIEPDDLILPKDPARVDSPYVVHSIESIAYENFAPSTDEVDRPETILAPYTQKYEEDSEKGVRVISELVRVETPLRSEILVRRERRESRDRDENIISIMVASRPHSRNNEDKVSIGSLDLRRSSSPLVSAVKIHDNSTAMKLDESNNKSGSTEKLAIDATGLTSFSCDSTNLEIVDRPTNTGNENSLQLSNMNASQPTQVGTSDKCDTQKRASTSRISRVRQKSRGNVARVAPLQPNAHLNERNASKARPVLQQCFNQLENNDWEIIIKGLKELSEIAREHPELLDSCPAGTLGRLLGRHVRSLRSQVSRAACLAAGDVFGSQARCIDQDLDDIAGPLLHRTADTNRFLRADCNKALDRMVQNLPPNKTILVIVHRGSTHQNALVRATTARLLASIVDRFGPDWMMSMQRDVREKLIATGAKLLMDGNLNARKEAKRMFRDLSGCENFRKVLKESVPEATLRHIDKTLRTL